MKRRAYCCDASRDLYEEYYSRQNGGEIPVLQVDVFSEDTGSEVSWADFFDDWFFRSSSRTGSACWQMPSKRVWR